MATVHCRNTLKILAKTSCVLSCFIQQLSRLMQFDRSLKEMSARQVCSQRELVRSQKRKYFCLERKFYSCQGIIRLHKKIIHPKGEIVLRVLKKSLRNMQQILLGCTNRLHDMSSHDKQANTTQFRNRAMLSNIFLHQQKLSEKIQKDLQKQTKVTHFLVPWLPV